MHILTSLQYDGPQTKFYQPEGSEQTTRTGSHHNHLWPSLHIGIFRPLIFIVVRLLIDIYPHLQIDEYLPLAGIDTPLQDTYPADGPQVEAILIGQPVLQSVFLCRYFRHHPYLIFIYHVFLPLIINIWGKSTKNPAFFCIFAAKI